MIPSSAAASPARRRPFWFIGLVVLLALAPLPFGANRPWASDALGLASGILLAALGWDLYRAPSLWPLGAPWRRLVASAALVIAVIGWGYLQTKDWLLCCHPIWDEARTVLGDSLAGAISLTPDRFSECALRMLAYAACFLLAFFGGRDIQRARALLRAIALIGVGYAFYGLLMKSSGLDIILWYKKWAYQGFLTSTFVNKNSYATYAGLGLQACIGLLWMHWKERPSLRLSAAALESIGARDVFIALMGLTVFGALILTSSRGGITSTLAGSFAFLFALALNRKWTGKQWLMILLPGIVFLIAFITFSADMLIDRLDPKWLQSNSMLRINAYATIFRALGENPWLGFGLGSFDSAFHLYRGADIGEWFEHAHNDYLELAMELGIPATLAWLGAIALMVSCCIQGALNRRRQEVFPILALAATVTVGVHGLVDFSMEIPAIAATYAALLGLGVAQSWSTREGSLG